ncbi:putative major facilitator superfamily transporter [Pseudomonas aeruginosa]|nr:putative major facilitator superfamily transporter [Pseudomonas aeruginosa]
MWRHPTRLGEEAEVTPSTSEIPVFLFRGAATPGRSRSIQIAYQVGEEDRQEFLQRIHAVGVKRRRDGAGFWRLYRELERADWYVERFIVDSWSDYLRQQTRTTLADREAEAQVLALHRGEEPPRVSHYVNEPLPRS